MTKVWFITGSSRGLGRTLTEAVLANGGQVAATARNTQQLSDLVKKYPGQVYPIQLDVTDKTQVTSAVASAVKHFGRIDVLVNNAGFGITGAAEAFTDEQVRTQLDTNLYAVIEVTRAVLPYMRKQRSGRILQVSSIGGRLGTPGISIYQAAKFGVSGFSESLAKEVTPLGIYVTSVEPGGFRTDWAGSSMSFAPAVEGYETTVGWMTDLFRGDQFVPMGDPNKAARVLIDLVEDPAPPMHLILGTDAIGMFKQNEAVKQAEFEKWLPVSISTDHENAVNFFESNVGEFLSTEKAN
jgi:NAD(P)-dependent dehydrogenase (short-subunit alcohol dehydrogenase family)